MPAGREHFCGISYISFPFFVFLCFVFHIFYILILISYLLFLVPFFIFPFFIYWEQPRQTRADAGRGANIFVEFLVRAIILEASKKNQSPEHCHALKAIGKKTDHICALYLYVSACTCHAHKVDGSFMILRLEISSRVWKRCWEQCQCVFCNSNSNTN